MQIALIDNVFVKKEIEIIEIMVRHHLTLNLTRNHNSDRITCFPINYFPFRRTTEAICNLRYIGGELSRSLLYFDSTENHTG